MQIEDDYVLRQIEQVIGLIEKPIRDLLSVAVPEVGIEKAGQAIDDAYDRLLNPDRRLFETLDESNLACMRGDPDRIERTTRLMQAEGDLLRARGEHEAAVRRYRRALGLLKTAGANPAAEDLLQSLADRMG